MKYPIIIVLFVISITNVHSQRVKGKWMIGNNTGILSTGSSTSSLSLANISLTNSALQDQNVFSFGFSPNVGYLFAENLSVGLRGNFSFMRISGEVLGMDRTSLLVGPQVNYFIDLNRKLTPYLTANALFGQNYIKTADVNLSEGMQSYGVGVGAAYFLNKNISINAEGFLNLNRGSSGSLTVPSGHRIGIDLGLNFFF